MNFLMQITAVICGLAVFFFRICETRICLSTECFDAAEQLKGSMNTDMDPCEDFYEYACGGWIKNHPVPSEESHWNLFSVIEHHLSFLLKGILENPEGVLDPGPVQLARKMYSACMDTDRMETVGLKPLIERLEKFGGWPLLVDGWQMNFDWQRMLVVLNRDLLATPLILISVGVDRKNSSQQIITVDQPTVVLPRSMLVEPDLYSNQLKVYKTWIKEVARLLAFEMGIKEDKIFLENLEFEIEELVQFEIKIAKLTAHPEMRRNVNRMYNSLTLFDLQRWTDTATSHRPVIDWLRVMKMLFKDTGYRLNCAERVIVRELDYLFNLAKLLEVTSLRTIANYLHWRLVRTYAMDLTSDMRKLLFQFDKVFTGAIDQHPRWKECVSATSGALSFAVGYKYTQMLFDDKAKQSVTEIVSNLQMAYLDQMERVSWMDESTKLSARRKVEGMARLIGYPSWYSNVSNLEAHYKGLEMGKDHLENMENSRSFASFQNLKKLRTLVDPHEWHTGPAVVNAYYNPQMNSIIFPAGILQMPFFSKGRPEALNYGGIGVVIGHEITHGFDDMGRQSDEFGNLVQWWSKETLGNYLLKTECFIDQYGHYSVPELDEILMRHVTMNGVTTLGENMADNGGLYQAYLAYQEYLAANGMSDSKLPGFESFTNDQLFFLGFATNWCESTTKESLLHEVLNDPHSPHKFRVQGSVANSPEFSKAFNCPIGSPMNPKHKCSFW